MKLFVDASALVAILATEPGFAVYSDAVDKAEEVLTSPVARWEAVRALARIDRMGHDEADRQVVELLSTFEIETISIGEREAAMAIQAYAKYGKGNHRAGLNMGDCFAYACAKANGARLLYKGNDFAQTDLA